MINDNFSITVGRQGQATGDNLWDLVFIQNKISDLKKTRMIKKIRSVTSDM